MSQGVVIVKRTSPRDIKMRDLYVKVDDLPERTLQFGEEAEFRVSAGTHRVTVTNRLYTKAMNIELAEDQEATFEAGNVTGKLMGTAMMVFGVGPYKVDLRRVD